MKINKNQLLRNKILDDLSKKRSVITHDDYFDVCTKKDFTDQMNYLKTLTGIEIRHFWRSHYKHSATAYRVSYK